MQSIGKGDMRMGLFNKLKESLSRTRESLSGRMDELVTAYVELDEDFYEDLTDILIMADVGMKTTELAVSQLRKKCQTEKIGDPKQAREELKKANADLEALYAASEQFSARIHENDIAQEEKRAQLSELDAQVKEQESAVAVLQTGIAHNEENIARVEEELRSQSDRVGSMDAQIAQQRARIEELEQSKNEVGGGV